MGAKRQKSHRYGLTIGCVILHGSSADIPSIIYPSSDSDTSGNENITGKTKHLNIIICSEKFMCQVLNLHILCSGTNCETIS